MEASGGRLGHAFERQPGELNTLQQAAAALLLGGDRRSYEQLVREFIEQQRWNESIRVREKLAKLCVLPRTPAGDQADVEAWIEDAVANSEDVSWAPFYPATQALAYYRYEKYEAALKAVTESDRRHALRGGKNDALYASLRLIESMCHAKTDDLPKAIKSFKKADEILRKQLDDPNLIVKAKYWHDWMFGKLMHDEACFVINKAIETAETTVPDE